MATAFRVEGSGRERRRSIVCPPGNTSPPPSAPVEKVWALLRLIYAHEAGRPISGEPAHDSQPRPIEIGGNIDE